MDDDEIDRFIKQLGLELSDVEEDEPDDEAPPSLDDLGDDDRERKPATGTNGSGIGRMTNG